VPLRGFFFDAQFPGQLIERGVTQEIEADHLHGALARTPPAVAQQEERGDERAVDLEGDSARGLRQPVTAAQDALEPLEKEFDAPAVAVNQRDEFRAQLLLAL